MMHACMKNLALNNLINYTEGAYKKKKKYFSVSSKHWDTICKNGSRASCKSCKGQIQKYLLRFTALILPVCSRINILQMKQINLQ